MRISETRSLGTNIILTAFFTIAVRICRDIKLQYDLYSVIRVEDYFFYVGINNLFCIVGVQPGIQGFSNMIQVASEMLSSVFHLRSGLCQCR